MKRDDDNTKLYAQMGLATLIPGMQRMIELMQIELDKMRNQLAGLQAQPRKVKYEKVGRPRGVSRGSTGWPTDPEERSREMHRRMKVRAAKKAKHPRDANHPDHAAWLKKVSAAAKKRWTNMSPRAQKERLAKMAASKKEKSAPVELEVAS